MKRTDRVTGVLLLIWLIAAWVVVGAHVLLVAGQNLFLPENLKEESEFIVPVIYTIEFLVNAGLATFCFCSIRRNDDNKSNLTKMIVVKAISVLLSFLISFAWSKEREIVGMKLGTNALSRILSLTSMESTVTVLGTTVASVCGWFVLGGMIYCNGGRKAAKPLEIASIAGNGVSCVYLLVVIALQTLIVPMFYTLTTIGDNFFFVFPVFTFVNRLMFAAVVAICMGMLLVKKDRASQKKIWIIQIILLASVKILGRIMSLFEQAMINGWGISYSISYIKLSMVLNMLWSPFNGIVLFCVYISMGIALYAWNDLETNE